MTITTRGFAVPALLGHQLAAYVDRSSQGRPRRSWCLQEALTTTYGLDLNAWRFRLVVDRIQSHQAGYWGPV
jgi:hypothetical protein